MELKYYTYRNIYFRIAGTELHEGLAKDIAFSETGITERELENARARLERDQLFH